MIIITGASDGLGKELAKAFTLDGKTVVNVSRTPSDTAVVNLKADLTDSEQINQATAEILALSEPIEALINCAGVLSVQSLEKITEAEIDRTLASNVEAPILLVSALASRLRQDGADIVNVSSTVGTKAYLDQAVYGTSKWALRGFSANLQLEIKDTPCRVISFCVGGFNSKIMEKATGEPISDPQNWMKSEDVAKCLKQLLELPKNMEISEIVINRKAAH